MLWWAMEPCMVEIWVRNTYGGGFIELEKYT
jgi:hypothetical protein